MPRSVRGGANKRTMVEHGGEPGRPGGPPGGRAPPDRGVPGAGPGADLRGGAGGQFLCVLCEALSRSAAVLIGSCGRGGVSP